MLGLLVLSTAHADESITVKVDSMSNVKGNGAIEACGTAVHIDGKRPLLVMLKHDESYYTALTAANGKWCVVFKRWTFSGKVDVSAATMDQVERSENQVVELRK